MQAGIDVVKVYLASHFEGARIERPSEGQCGAEVIYGAKGFRIELNDNFHLLYVSDAFLQDHRGRESEGLRRSHIAEWLREVGKQPLLVTNESVRLIVDWVGPYHLIDRKVRLYAPAGGGVYILAEPLPQSMWKPHLVGQHDFPSSHLQTLAERFKPGKLHLSFFCAAVETGPSSKIIRDRVVRFLAATWNVQGASATNERPLAVNLPQQMSP
jgi:hypothetical protein